MFELHPQLRQDCIVLGRFRLSLLLLMNDSHYPWLILVPQREGIREIHQLSAAERQQLWDESNYLSERLAGHYRPDKLNIAALGNVVPQLHLHHVVRYRHDPAWPAPVWGKLPAAPYTPEALAEICDELRGLLGARLQVVERLEE